jgi:hypothetical protein
MPHFATIAIMPKDTSNLAPSYRRASNPYPSVEIGSSSVGTRNAAIWSAADDKILLEARASGKNWGPIAARHFPGKTPNACRKRHERLMEKRQGEDWDATRLDLMCQEYMAMRKEIWEPLASRLGEKWTHVEAKVSHGATHRFALTADVHNRSWRKV